MRMPLSPSRRGGPAAGSSRLLVVLALLAAVLLGIAPAALSVGGTAIVLVLCGGVLGLLVLRAAFGGASGGSGRIAANAAALWEQARGPADRDLRIQRGLFYLGSLTVTEAAWRPAFGLTVAEILFIASFAGCVFAVLRGHRVARVPAGLVVGVALFAFGGALSSFGADSPAGSGTQVLHAVYVMLLWVWTGTMVLRTRRQLLLAVSLWTVSTALSGFAAIAQVMGVESIAGALEGNRATGFTDHPNDLGGAASVALVPALMLATAPARSGSIARAVRWLVVALIAAAIALSASVAAMAGALVATVVWLSSPAVRAPTRVAIVGGLAVCLIAAVTVAGGVVTSPTERLQQVTSSYGTNPASGSGEERLAIVRTAWPRISQDPLVGAGLDTPDTIVTVLSGGQTKPYQIHGAPLAAWYEAGIFGVLGILVAFGALFWAGWRALVAAPGQSDQLVGWALLAAFGAFFVYAMTAPLFFQQFGWFAAVLLVAWGRVAPASDRLRAPGPTWPRAPELTPARMPAP